jgi:hypothetical protein
LISTHRHTYLYRVIASVIAFGLLIICAVLYAVSGPLPAIVTALPILGVLVWFFRSQASERLLLHRDGLCLTRGATSILIYWTDLSRVDVQWAYSGDPPGFFEATIKDLQGRTVVLRANWTDRQSIDYLLQALVTEVR